MKRIKFLEMRLNESNMISLEQPFQGLVAVLKGLIIGVVSKTVQMLILMI